MALLIDLPRPRAPAIRLEARLICQQGQQDSHFACPNVTRLGQGLKRGEGGRVGSPLLSGWFMLFSAVFSSFQPVNKYKCCLPLGAVESKQSITVTGRWCSNLQLPRHWSHSDSDSNSNSFSLSLMWKWKVLPTQRGRLTNFFCLPPFAVANMPANSMHLLRTAMLHMLFVLSSLNRTEREWREFLVGVAFRVGCILKLASCSNLLCVYRLELLG